MDRGGRFCSMNQINDKKKEKGRKNEGGGKRDLLSLPLGLLQDRESDLLFFVFPTVMYVSPSHLIFRPQIFIYETRERSETSVPHGERRK